MLGHHGVLDIRRVIGRYVHDRGRDGAAHSGSVRRLSIMNRWSETFATYIPQTSFPPSCQIPASPSSRSHVVAVCGVLLSAPPRHLQLKTLVPVLYEHPVQLPVYDPSGIHWWALLQTTLMLPRAGC
jgi:hypothetical protein